MRGHHGSIDGGVGDHDCRIGVVARVERYRVAPSNERVAAPFCNTSSVRKWTWGGAAGDHEEDGVVAQRALSNRM